MNKLVINADLGKHRINKNIYGHFSEHLGRCIYEGYWVGEDSPIPNTRGIRNDVVQALRKIKPPVMRWPGGCFADDYHWMDGIGSREKRPTIVNVHWGGVTENNHFGTHEFFDLCEQLDTQPYICGNVGSGTVREMRDWVEYITFDGKSPMTDLRRENGRDEPWKLPYFGVGNENWGCGGCMRPEYYANEYKRYACYVRNLSGNMINKIACGPCDKDYHWTDVLMREAAETMQGLALHYYCGTGHKSRSATVFEEDDWFTVLKSALFMEELVTKHSTIMDHYDPHGKVGLMVDEWGTWHDIEPGTNPGFLYQQNTLRDALVAGLTLNIFNNHCERVQMANIAQTINVLQAMILTEGEKMLCTPTYHVFEMYTVHQDATMLPISLTCSDYEFDGDKIPTVSASASVDSESKIHVTLCNTDPNTDAEISCELRGVAVSSISSRVLTSSTINAHNTFDTLDNIKPEAFDGAKITSSGFTAKLPAKSIVVIEIK